MNVSTLEAKVNDFLAQKRIAVAGVSRKHDITVIAGACPMMYRVDGVSPDFGHTCMRWILKFTGRLPR